MKTKLDSLAKVLVAVVLLSGLASVGHAQNKTILDLTEIEASDITNDAQLFFGTERTGLAQPRKLSLEELKKTGVQVVNVLQYGADPTGATDTTAIVEQAVSENPGKIIFFPPGTYLIESQVDIAVDCELRGDRAVMTCHVDGIAFAVSSNCTIDGITFDGDDFDLLEQLLVCSGSSTESCIVRNCTFKNMQSDTFCYALQIGNGDQFHVVDCKFADISAVENGTVGDTNGVARAIAVTYDNNLCKIHRCSFVNIHNVDGSGNTAYEDADAIQCFLGSGTYQYVDISDCGFIGCQKRAMKFQGKSGSVYRVSDCFIKSSFTGTGDLVGTADNGMFSAISTYSGTTVISNVTVVGGVVGYFLEVGTSAVDAVFVTNCIHKPEYHRYVAGLSTAFVYIASTVPDAARIGIRGCTSLGTYFGVNGLSNSQLSMVGNTLSCESNCVDYSGDDIVFAGNDVSFFANVAISGSPYGLYLADGIKTASIVGNTFRDMGDGVYVTAQSAAFKVVAVGNAFDGLTRNILSNFGSETAPDLIFTKNVPNSTVVE